MLIEKIRASVIGSFLESKYLSQWFVLIIEAVISTMASVLAFILVKQMYRGLNVIMYSDIVIYALPAIASVLLFMLVFRTYRGVVRYSGIYDFQRIFIALSCSNILLFMCLFLFLKIPGSIALGYCTLFFSINIIVSQAFRLIVVAIYRQISDRNHIGPDIPVYIWGVGDHSVSTSQMLNAIQKKYKVKGFISTSKVVKASKLSNYPILYITSPSDLGTLNLKNSAVLFTNISELKNLSEYIDALLKQNVVLYKSQIDDIKKINSKKDIYSHVSPINVKDLLERPEININIEVVKKHIQNQTVLVTGAAGSIGSEIVRQLTRFGARKIICFDVAETPLHDLFLNLTKIYPDVDFSFILGDIRNESIVAGVFKKFNPNIVYHAAAYKHVPLLEQFPSEAVLCNVHGTRNLVDASIKYNVTQFVMVSTDKAVNPTNVMGCSKRIAEIYVQSAALDKEKNRSNTVFITTRFGNVLGSNGSVVPLFKKQIEEGGPLTVSHPDITRYFMTIPEACKLVLESSAIGDSGHIYVFDMGEPVKILDMAKKMIELTGLEPDKHIDIVYSGLRPGEKLFEELLSDSESQILTNNRKVMIAKVREYPFDIIEHGIDEVIALAKKNEYIELVALMKKIVPEYISKNSEFEMLDEKVKN